MKEFSNETEKSLYSLAMLQGLPSRFGWKAALADKIGIKRNSISTWIHRNAIPPRKIEHIERQGYPREQWFLENSVKSAPQSTISPGRVVEDASPRVLPYAPTARPSHGEVIEWFRDKEWAIEMNMLLVDIERSAPDKKDLVAAYIKGVLDGAKDQKRGHQS